MFNIQEYWRQIRSIERTIAEEEPWVFSIEDPTRDSYGGNIVQVSREAAAKAIAAKTHRLATQEEIDAHFADERRRADRQAANARERAGICLYPMAPKETRGGVRK